MKMPAKRRTVDTARRPTRATPRAARDRRARSSGPCTAASGLENGAAPMPILMFSKMPVADRDQARGRPPGARRWPWSWPPAPRRGRVDSAMLAANERVRRNSSARHVQEVIARARNRLVCLRACRCSPLVSCRLQQRIGRLTAAFRSSRRRSAGEDIGHQKQEQRTAQKHQAALRGVRLEERPADHHRVEQHPHQPDERHAKEPDVADIGQVTPRANRCLRRGDSDIGVRVRRTCLHWPRRWLWRRWRSME